METTIEMIKYNLWSWLILGDLQKSDDYMIRLHMMGLKPFHEFKDAYDKTHNPAIIEMAKNYNCWKEDE